MENVMINPIQKIRNEYKQISNDIKELKIRRKPSKLEELGPYECKSETSKKITWDKLSSLRYYARHYHIASSEMRGTPREKIENKFNEAPNETLIKEYKDEWIKEIIKYRAWKEECNEVVCSN
jgi:hypothetical protein